MFNVVMLHNRSAFVDAFITDIISGALYLAYLAKEARYHLTSAG
jgi:hypothetical protein